MATTKNGWTMTRDTTTGNYTLEKSITANGDQTILVKCANKNMTGDVRVNVGVSVPGIVPTGTFTVTQPTTGADISSYANLDVPAATPAFTGGVASITNATNSMTTTMSTVNSSTYYVNVQAKAKATRTTITYNGAVDGWVEKANGATASASNTSAETTVANTTIYIQKGVLGAGVSGNITFTPSVATNMATITKPSSGTEGTDYFSITGSGTKSGSVNGTANVSTEGYVKNETASGGSASGSISADAKKYIAKATITNNTSGGSSSGTINRGSQIKIGQGYNPSDIYYTAQANSGTVTIANSGNTSCDGKTNVSVPAGSAAINNVAVSATISSVSIAYDATDSNFVVSGNNSNTGAISANVSIPGWITSVSGATATANAIVSATISKISLSAATTGSTNVRPAITAYSKSSSYSYEDAYTGAVTTTTPTSGVYIRLRTAAKTTSLTSKATVSSAGYGTTATFTTIDVATTIGALASSYTYVPVKVGSVTQPSASQAASSITLSGTNITLSAMITPSVSAGWVSSGTSGTVTLTGTVPTEAITVTATGNAQTITPTSGKLISSVTVEGLYKEISSSEWNVSSGTTYRVEGKLKLFVQAGDSTQSIEFEDVFFRINDITIGSGPSGSTSITCVVLNTNSSNALVWEDASISVTRSSGFTTYTAKIYYTGKIYKCYGGTTTTSIAYASGGTSSYSEIGRSVTFTSSRYILQITASGGTNSSTKYIKAKYMQISSLSSSGSTGSGTKSGSATVKYKDSESDSWQSLTCSASGSTSYSGYGTAYCYIYQYPDLFILFN